MTELQHVVSLSELYERLIDRLGLALETASTSVRLRNESPAELELKGLSSAELQLIEAYLEKGLGAADVSVRDRLIFQPELGRPSRASATIIWLKDRRRGKSSARLGRHS
ncbi:hypothetical protein AAY86_15805 [Pseudomonas amygdali pv. tabaci str. ATCC 11528]|uniref:Uncharacterized protein n=5 Tax=Pseudomonas syringae group genomosp. 2 TaxID=251698 RepID=A0AAX1W2Y5_PSEAJ|nr:MULTISPECIES: hypothetical protein [Pseudomonas syringae group]ARA82984.1 hypothetical protein B5U27_24470 [Pseudomonas amygdali pv. lachrymans]AXH54508.1 hypothetical protein PLA107_003570 [Pseudomonas amygdali pv. lachrymans str. M301315]KEZ26250.1 hypothetical protein A3SK_0117025 [Pseudomonas amygdali pv. tabaci str. 6605]KEZ70537.1 hypothetical protein C1E_0203055 [Pseudomonas amygdali pv. tabaci str. ATCC 11528]KIY18353.1 hypothetical protein RD00_11045 [Pseudomonas amygdali pv. tabac